MGVTTIKSLRNSTELPLWVVNREYPPATVQTRPGAGIELAANGGASTCNISIPWAWDSETFQFGSSKLLHGNNPSHITVYADANLHVPVISIFQRDDNIRYVIGETWSDSALLAHGANYVDGNRSLEFIEEADANLQLQTVPLFS
jgi:hypothetical protein